VSRATTTMYQAWRCEHCGASGSLGHEPSDDCLTVAAAIDEQHAIASGDCAEKHGSSGIRLATTRQEVRHGR
jgi:hypothetical protein